MRIKNNAEFSLDSDAATPDVVNQLLGAAERKRARPASSLDIKVSNGENLTRPPKSKTVAAQGQQSSQEQQHALKESKRPRGGSGIPHTKVDLSDLDSLTNEEIMQALYDDPELAAIAAAAAEKMQKKSQVPPAQDSPKRSRITSGHPAHLKAMMDEGVPVKQWIVLLVLLAAGLYQLRKAISLPKKTNVGITVSAKKVDKQTSRKGGKKKGKASVSTRNKPNNATAPPLVVHAQRSTTPLEEELLVEELKVASGAKEETKNNKKKKVRKPKEQHKETQNVAKETISRETPDSVSTDGSSSTEGGAEDAGDERRTDTAPNDGDEWHTVVATHVAKGPTHIESSDHGITIESKESQLPIGEPKFESDVSKKKKKKKANKSASTVVTPAPAVSEDAVAESAHAPINTTEDEALAIKLQLEEEKLVKHEIEQEASLNVWEEVAIKKKKR